jgi:limonene-1,2-epoxide hydrolase
MSNIETVISFIAAWNARDLEAILAAFSDEAVYHNIPMAPLEGRDAIRASLTGGVVDTATSIDWIISRIAVCDDGAVMTERVDAFVVGGKAVSLPIMGIFEFTSDGKIAAWRDYFDLAQYTRQL